MEKTCLGRPLSLVIRITLPLFASIIFVAAAALAAQEDFPKKEVTIIVNYGPGGARDTLARGVGNTMSKYLGVPVVVINVVGAGGALGFTKLYGSPPDGYTMGIGAATESILQLVQKQDYDMKKFAYIGKAEHSPVFWFVKSDSPFHSIKDFKNFGKPIRHSSFGMATNGTVSCIVVAERAGFPLTVVGGYKGAADATMALVRGEVETSSPTLASAMPFVKNNQIRPILAFDDKRSAYFPQVPTVGEAGYPEFAILALDLWFLAPPGVPKARIKILEDALMKTLKDPEFVKWAKGAGVELGPLGSQETTKLVLDLDAFFEKYKKSIAKFVEK
jgi:tripartite-type tricarboxylate transporter receptor subunit TctC